ncbi:type IX secretion system membrane protein PorP/SprF [Maribacter sp. PR1]|uniref:Type IX secretion system membrane protein PorP/SprF n=1 Tax=Maribacter cobaltidurans TaxID=1178778 RepID=A0ABU7IPU0_9FLAO|nr:MULTISPECIES: type IX secretion system membrane protein PorP/SprF [Maribacter]MDC6387303.1 type IX secretion system membrane protein PorP/SprF [Maribacter sp. PR1]MEE1974688.1 type IX secretion system membrane protein PorP/SprF [Maribacter cobaltidurans]
MKKRIFNKIYKVLLFSVVLSMSIANAQKEPQYTQYMYNIGSFNPAYVGSVLSPEITAMYRAQWIDIPGAPRTIRVGANVPMANEKHGLGLNIVNDQLGPVSQTYFDLAYSFQINISSTTYLSFGIDAGGSALNVDFSKGTFENPGEPILNRQTLNEFYPTVGAGLFLYSDNWYLGTSVPNFLTEGIYNDDVATIIEDRLQFNFIGGYVFNLSDNLKFKPAFLINSLQGNPLNMNVSANFLISNSFTAGASYRINNAFSGLAGFQISQGMFVGYSYDYNTNLLGDFNNGSHEIILKFSLGLSGENKTRKAKDKELKNKPKQIDSPRFF